MMGGAHMLEAITAPSCSDEYSDSSAGSSSSSDEEEAEETVSSKEDVSRSSVTMLQQFSYNAFLMQANNNVLVVQTDAGQAETVIEMVVDGVSATATGSTPSNGSVDGPEVDSEEERAVTVGENSDEEVLIRRNV